MSLRIDDVILPGNVKSFTAGTRTQATSLSDLLPFFLSLLEKPVTASVATINPDGRPQLTPNWCTHDGTYLYLNSVRDHLKDKNIRARPDVTDDHTAHPPVTLHSLCVQFIGYSGSLCRVFCTTL